MFQEIWLNKVLPPQLPAPVTAHAVVETPASNGSASSPSLELSIFGTSLFPKWGSIPA
ncbi:hypothetical protein OROMI_012538 [Orobanche minor]